ncbi:MAG: hypothetical protein HQL29_05150 [Candidatus Omnitrophica bacterium]|nr:hypothetical protein [Candidatus Omnitrophota bacterium]
MITMCCDQNDFKIEELKAFSVKTGIRVILRGVGEVLNGEFTEWKACDVLTKYKI